MNKMLTFQEKRYIENLLKSSKQTDSAMWPSWGGWISFAMGGFLIAYVCFLTAFNLSAENVKSVLSPGIVAGMTLILGGYWVQHMSKKDADNKIMAGILRKLI